MTCGTGACVALAAVTVVRVIAAAIPAAFSAIEFNIAVPSLMGGSAPGGAESDGRTAAANLPFHRDSCRASRSRRTYAHQEVFAMLLSRETGWKSVVRIATWQYLPVPGVPPLALLWPDRAGLPRAWDRNGAPVVRWRRRAPAARSVRWGHAYAPHSELDPHRGAVAGHHRSGAGRRRAERWRCAGAERGGHLHRVGHPRLPG
ncbi:exported protein of unknown function [Streptomyces sp. KY75]|nr:exported protein of unknown function [Streptomyces sp. KY70]CAD5995206.1 exported protein of unknown function [Streptomyces sp. KY75]